MHQLQLGGQHGELARVALREGSQHAAGIAIGQQWWPGQLLFETYPDVGADLRGGGGEEQGSVLVQRRAGELGEGSVGDAVHPEGAGPDLVVVGELDAYRAADDLIADLGV